MKSLRDGFRPNRECRYKGRNPHCFGFFDLPSYATAGGLHNPLPKLIQLSVSRCT
jgi:hypothetical protein